MIIHSCGTPIVVRYQINCLSSFGITLKGIKLGVSRIREGKGDNKLYCPACEKIVLPEELVVICSHCGERFTLDNSYKPNNCGGYYCSNCLDKVGETGVILSKLLPK